MADHLTPEERAAFAERAAARAEITPPRSARRGTITPRRDGARRRCRSTRYYLAMGEDFVQQAVEGEISPAAMRQFVGAAKDLNEMFLQHRVLEMQGQDKTVDVTPAPEEEYQPREVAGHRTMRVTVRRGQDRMTGEPIDEKTVTISSTSPGDNPEVDAEMEALT